ncbi:PAS domain-containing protein [Roseibium sp. MMSF_3544]|uniref:PAS domain-containing protein n=1 Tax=unclassified Roseibium TaxID=2629323 RepID=UPI00273FAEE3|nr:PAS domain-containing protein [Roseibium sp. MMSF_3544]
MPKDVVVTGVERFFGDDELIVSKTDLKGRITYCNDVFLQIAGYTEKECIGHPHSIIRHPEMPRCVFDLLWEFIQSGREIFAYVKNRCKNGDHYWVQAHVTPSKDRSGTILGYHSNRRVPDRDVLENAIFPLYDELLQEERRHGDRKSGLQASKQLIDDFLAERNMPYDEFIARL